jgi:hypothetical protein
MSVRDEWFRLDSNWYHRQIIDGTDSRWEAAAPPPFVKVNPDRIASATAWMEGPIFNAEWVEV